MGKWIVYFFLCAGFTLISGKILAQTPAPGTVTFKFQSGTQTNSYSSYADFVPTSSFGQDGGYGYDVSIYITLTGHTLAHF